MIKKTLSALLVGVALTLMGCPPPPATTGDGKTTPPADTGKGPDGGNTNAAPDTPAATGETPAAAAPAKVDLSHLKVGQKFTYVMSGGVQMVYTIKEITPENTVKYTTQSMMDMGQGLQPVGDPTPMEMAHAAPVAATTATTAAQPAAGTKISREKVKVGDTEFDCMVSETGETKAYMSYQGDTMVFPGVVKTLQAGAVMMELTKIEKP